uniref:DRBM domain-containing protein n=1 Tax=Timema bartmani TaxID=61472 RepID=A0A7R9I3E5_9NEOP|nr:unnamed protein product [Timema bartmani]
MPIFLHKHLRVVTWTKPYFLGPGSARSLDANSVQEYCRRLFRFKDIEVLRFRSWSDRRRFTKQKKQQRQLNRPTLPEGTKLIKFPIQFSDNAATPYSATVMISDMQYGVGYGTSKKQAKSDAAKATLEILIPEMRDKIQEDKRIGSRAAGRSSDTDLSFFDEIKIEDPRVFELCSKTTEPSPYAILLTCLQRNFGLGEMDIKYEVNTLRHQKNEFTMSVGAHTAKVICKNKREGKQRTSQAILQALHPHITSWGSLLRMYGNRSVKSVKDKKHEEQEITLLQSKASINQPNWAILDKLRQEMGKLSDKPSPIGKFVPPADENLPSTSGADLNNVQL